MATCCKPGRFYIPLVQLVANLHVMIDPSGCELVGNQKSCELVANYSWQLVSN